MGVVRRHTLPTAPPSLPAHPGGIEYFVHLMLRIVEKPKDRLQYLRILINPDSPEGVLFVKVVSNPAHTVSVRTCENGCCLMHRENLVWN